MITNAFCHRDYDNQHTKVIIKIFSNRISFYNPSGLIKKITPKNIEEKQFSRNQVIAGVLAKVKYIEEVGEGWNKIIKEHKQHPLKPKLPSIESDEYTMLVNLFSTKEKFKEKEELILTKRQQEILNYLKKEGMITTSQCAKLLNVSNDTALRELVQLKSLKLIKQRGIGRAIHYVTQ